MRGPMAQQVALLIGVVHAASPRASTKHLAPEPKLDEMLGSSRSLAAALADKRTAPADDVALQATPCSREPAAVCTNNPSEPCYYDPSCSEGESLGCNAGGVDQNCRFCGFGEFEDVPCPERKQCADDMTFTGQLLAFVIDKEKNLRAPGLKIVDYTCVRRSRPNRPCLHDHA